MPTMKQFNQERFFALREKLTEWHNEGLPENEKQDFIMASVEYQSLKQYVPKKFWKIPKTTKI